MFHGTQIKVIWPFAFCFPFNFIFRNLLSFYYNDYFCVLIVSEFCWFKTSCLLTNFFITWIFKLWNDGAQIIQFCRKSCRYFACHFTFVQPFKFPCFLRCFSCLWCFNSYFCVDILFLVLCNILFCCFEYFTTLHF